MENNNMRKTDQKRQHIIDTAYRLFQRKGFANTSMSEITAQVGGSKATVYNYFSSKEALFVECMNSASDEYVKGIFDVLQDAKAGKPGIAEAKRSEIRRLFRR